ncbi:uncharacterized protein LOC117651106 [Thrips palmi]|uniref:Uncharacterized protein LOC117651106 n=1 Tax=Thrips palmi TaxID=161013 RepID=A0A6P8ZZ71_THRPL|nr:uncharacterized protein LOC117651106 [Thrips palmi]
MSVSPANLIPGVRYPIVMLTQKCTYCCDEKKPFTTLIACVQDPMSNEQFHLTLPSLYNDLDPKQVKELNDSISLGEAPVVVFYGQDGKHYNVRIHRHDGY